jgi:hypothetical protein
MGRRLLSGRKQGALAAKKSKRRFLPDWAKLGQLLPQKMRRSSITGEAALFRLFDPTQRGTRSARLLTEINSLAGALKSGRERRARKIRSTLEVLGLDSTIVHELSCFLDKLARAPADPTGGIIMQAVRWRKELYSSCCSRLQGAIESGKREQIDKAFSVLSAVLFLDYGTASGAASSRKLSIKNIIGHTEGSFIYLKKFLKPERLIKAGFTGEQLVMLGFTPDAMYAGTATAYSAGWPVRRMRNAIGVKNAGDVIRIGKNLGVEGSTIVRWLNRLGFQKEGRHYWVRLEQQKGRFGQEQRARPRKGNNTALA